MLQIEIQKGLETKLELMKSAAVRVTETNSIDAILAFKKEMKTVKAFMEFVRVHKDGSALKMSEKCKKIYLISGAIEEIAHKIDLENPRNIQHEEQLHKLVEDWIKSCDISALEKMIKQLISFNYSGVPIQLMQNFVNNFFMKMAE